MAKVSLNKLNLKIDNSISTLKFNEQDIEVKQYLPINEKLDMISTIINESADETRFYNVGKLDVFETIELIKHYTNITFTDKQLEDIPKLYDLVVSTGLYDMIYEAIPEIETVCVHKVLMDTVDSIYKYQNSVFGVLEAVTTDYENLKFDTAELQKNISNPENLTLLKDIVTKLG